MVYNKKKLEAIVDEWGDWREYKENFHTQEKGPFDYDLRVKVGSKYNKLDPVTYANPLFLTGKSADLVDKAIRNGSKRAENSVLDYTDKNWSYMFVRLSNLDVKKLYSQAMSIMPKKIGSAAHDSTANLHLEVLYLQSLLGNGEKPKIDDMRKYVLSQIEDGYMRDFAGALIASNPEETIVMFNNWLKAKNAELQSKFIHDKQFNKSLILNYITNNIRKLKSNIDAETDKDKKDDLKDIRNATYLSIAKNLYDVEKENEEKT